MKHICPHNSEVSCNTPKCGFCGWNPKVAQKRLDDIKKGKAKMLYDKRYKIPFTGYCEVYAKDPEEALAKAETVEMQFFAHYDYGNAVCLDEEDEDEMD